jgi:hypothetical protein
MNSTKALRSNWLARRSYHKTLLLPGSPDRSGPHPGRSRRLAPAILTLLLLGQTVSLAQVVPYGVAARRWPEPLGSHRALVRVEQEAPAVWVHLPWRRRDLQPERKNVVVTDLATGQPVRNVVRLNVTREFGDLVFQPATVPGDYAVYYLPFKHVGAGYFPNTVYEAPADTAEPAWRQRLGLAPPALAEGGWRQLPQVRVLGFQACSEFDRSDPMEVIATADETRALLAQHPDSAYCLFPEDRRFPIRMTDDLPLRWITSGASDRFSGEAQPGEFYVFQVGLYAARQAVENLGVRLADLKRDEGGANATAALRCFNLGGTNWLGRPFTKTVSVPRGKVQALWFGLQVPEQAPPGRYTGRLVFQAHGLPERTLGLTLTVAGQPLPDAGDSELWRQSRLRWLDSTLGLDDDVVPSYPPVAVEDNTVAVLGRTMKLADTGLPAGMTSTFSDALDQAGLSAREILARPIGLVVETADGTVGWQGGHVRMVEQHAGTVTWESRSTGGPFAMTCRATMDGDGYINYALKLQVDREAEVRDVRLEIPFRREIAKYIMGLGCKGGIRPAAWKWKWNVSLANHRLWLGDASAGLHCKLKGPQDTWELYNLKNSGLPESWHNAGQGGAELAEEAPEVVLVRFYSGPRRLQPAGELLFRFGLMATPVKVLNPEHWNWRYWHADSPVDEVARSGANIINVHHANDLNPFINYPFLANDKLKPYVDQAHRLGIKVKLYYTIRELSNHAAELWALRSLDHEVFRQGPGFRLADQFASRSADLGDSTTGNAWLCEHLVTDYVPAWHHPFGGGVWDAAIATTGLSRWHNYYLEGMAWLIRNVGVDGLYLDGIGYDREIMKRLRKVMDRTRPGCLIDFHCGNHYLPQYGLNNIVNQHLEHLPYIDSLWLGEGFNYDEAPEYWLVELSGLPFGLFSEMLGVGNPWRGMLFGMSNRLPYAGGDPRPLWKAWDAFGIKEARMSGWWNPGCPVKTDQTNVLATAYVRPGKTLLALASWAPHRTTVSLALDWKALGLDPKKTTFLAPAIEHFQPGAVFAPDSRIRVNPGKGWLLIADETPRKISADDVGLDPLHGLKVKVEMHTPFEISIPANTVATKDMRWAEGTTAAVARIDPRRDNGQTWGLGLALGWADGKYVQIHSRSDGRWGVVRNGTEALLGDHALGQPATVAIKLGDQHVQLFAREHEVGEWDLIAEFSRRDFPGTPATLRVGKIGPSWMPRDHGDKGTTNPCRVEWVRQYE